MKMSSALLISLLLAPLARAQDLATSFTLGTPSANCIAVASQDGVSTNGQGAVCPDGFFGGASLQLSLPNDPVVPGNSLSLYTCAVTVLSNTVPPVAKTPQAPGSLVQGLSCPLEYPWYSAIWSGTLTYDYTSVLQRHCTGGRGAHCVTNYYPVWAGGSGALSTPQPPPPPPQPVVTTLVLDLAAAPCDASLVCMLLPTDTNQVDSALIDVYGYALSVYNANGTVSTSPLDSVQLVPLNDDGDAYTIIADGTLYDQAGDSNQTVEAQFVIRANDNGPFGVTSGTLSIITTTNP